MTEAVKYRRHFHKYPETGDDTVLTAAYIEDILKSTGCEITKPIPNSVCGIFDFGKEETVAFRADMDALPVEEKTGLEFSSATSGVMHACGHDGHMAILLGFVDKLEKLTKEPKRNLLVIFQPAEETTGGAKRICDTGIFEKYNVTRVFAYHIMPDIPMGKLASRPGALMAKSCEVTLDFKGVSAHIGKASEGRDALFAAVRFVSESYICVEKEMSDVEFKLLKFGKLTSGSARNAISDNSHIEGSIRCYSQEDFVRLKDIVRRTAEKIETETGVVITPHFSEGYLPVYNDKKLFEKVSGALDVAVLDEPKMTAEDFSYYQEKAPGVFLFLGSGSGIPLHSDMYDFDEAVLEIGVNGYEKLFLMD